MPSSSKGPAEVEDYKRVGWSFPCVQHDFSSMCMSGGGSPSEDGMWRWSSQFARDWGVSWNMGLSVLKLESSGTPRCCRAGSQAAKGQKRIEVLARRGFVAHALGPIWGAKEVRPSPGSDLQNSIYSFIQILIECLLGVRHWGLCRRSNHKEDKNILMEYPSLVAKVSWCPGPTPTSV